MTFEYQDYLAHHGVKGQKWGVRRFQNDDGTLTAAGRERYGSEGTKEDWNHRPFSRKIIGGDGGYGWIAKKAMQRQRKKIRKATQKGDERAAEKWKSKNAAYRANEANVRAYRSHASTGKLIGQTAVGLIAGLGSFNYRHARARGSSRAVAFLESVPVLHLPMRLINDRKAYGHLIIGHSATD